MFFWNSLAFSMIQRMLWKCCTQYASKYGKLSSGHRTGKGQFSFQSQRKANAKDTIAVISHASKAMLKILQARLQQYVNHELPDVQAEEPEIKLPTSIGSLKKQESSRKTSIYALLTMPKPLTVGITINWKILRDRNTRPPDLPLEKFVCMSGSNS